MGHHHHSDLKGRMLFSIVLNLAITLAEVVGGILSGSLALLSDSLHNFSDTMSLIASYFAIRIGERERNEKYTFGYKRAEILVAFINSAVLVGVALFLVVEAYKRFRNPNPIEGTLMLVVMSDTLSSVAVVLGGIAIIKWNVLWIDPLITVLIAVYVLYEGFEILKESVEVLMEASPDIDLETLRREIEDIPGVRNAHHFHVWRIGEGEVHFECHVEVEDMPLSEAQRIIDEVEKRLRQYGIAHVTVQLEVGRCENPSVICRE